MFTQNAKLSPVNSANGIFWEGFSGLIPEGNGFANQVIWQKMNFLSSRNASFSKKNAAVRDPMTFRALSL